MVAVNIHYNQYQMIKIFIHFSFGRHLSWAAVTIYQPCVVIIFIHLLALLILVPYSSHCRKNRLFNLHGHTEDLTHLPGKLGSHSTRQSAGLPVSERSRAGSHRPVSHFPSHRKIQIPLEWVSSCDSAFYFNERGLLNSAGLLFYVFPRQNTLPTFQIDGQIIRLGG